MSNPRSKIVNIIAIGPVVVNKFHLPYGDVVHIGGNFLLDSEQKSGEPIESVRKKTCAQVVSIYKSQERSKNGYD